MLVRFAAKVSRIGLCKCVVCSGCSPFLQGVLSAGVRPSSTLLRNPSQRSHCTLIVLAPLSKSTRPGDLQLSYNCTDCFRNEYQYEPGSVCATSSMICDSLLYSRPFSNIFSTLHNLRFLLHSFALPVLSLLLNPLIGCKKMVGSMLGSLSSFPGS